MSNCEFCSGKQVNAEYVGDGIQTMGMMLDQMFGASKKEKNFLKNGIQLKDGKLLTFDNSAAEYAPLAIEIQYCPFCGKKLTRKDV